MEMNTEHILDCLDQYGKGELTGEQVNEALTGDEKIFLLMHPEFFETEENVDDWDVLDWLNEDDSFYMVVEVDERLCREAEAVIETLGVEMPTVIESFLQQLIQTKQFSTVAND